MAYKIPDNVDYVKYFHRVGVQESQDLHWGYHWRDKMIERMEYGEQQTGATLPWHKMRDFFRVRPGEATLWAGEDGHRKSLIVGQSMLWLARKQRVCIMSLEMEPDLTLFRMCQQAAGCTPSTEYIDMFAKWTDSRIAVYDQLDTVPSEKVFGVACYAAQELGCEHIVIDSLMKCGHDIDDYAGHVRFADQLSRIAKALKIHIHLVHHMKKPAGQGEDHGKSRIHGSSQFPNNFHNVLTVWFNEKRMEALQAVEKGMEISSRQQDEIDSKHDQIITIRKQRNGIPYKAFGFYFDERSLQLTEQEGKRVTYNLEKDDKPVPASIEPYQELYGEQYVPGASA